MPKYGENLVNENIVLIFTLSANCVQLFVYCVQKQRFIGGELFCIRCIVISHFFKGMDRCTCFCLQFTVSMMRTTLPCGKKEKKILQQCLFLSNFFETVCLNLLVCVCLRIKGIVFLMSTLFQRVHWNNHKD